MALAGLCSDCVRIIQYAMDTQLLKKEILFRCRRGLKETDLLLGGYVGACLEALSPEQLGQLALLLKATDQDLLAWLVEEHRPAPEHAPAVAAILAWKGSR